MRVTRSIRTLERLFFAGIIIFLPFRYPITLIQRPIPPIYKEYTNVTFFISDGFLLATLCLWAIDLVINRRRIQISPAFLTLPILALTALGLLSVTTSVDPFYTIYNFVRFLLLFGLYLFVNNEIGSMNQIIIPVAVQVFLQASIAIQQTLLQRSIGLQYLGELSLDPEINGISVVLDGSNRFLRAYGLTDHPNILGGCLAFGLLILISQMGKETTRWRWLGTSVFIVGSTGLFLTFSRSAWLAFLLGCLVGLAILFLTQQREARNYWLRIIGMTLLVISPFVLSSLRFIGIRLNWSASFSAVPQEIQSIGERALLNQAANQLFSTHALTGVGLSAFPQALQQQSPDLPVAYQPAHLVLLDTAVELGVFGGLAFVLTITTPWAALWSKRKSLIWSADLIGGSILLLAVILVGFFDYYPWLLNPGRLWMWLAWGLWAAMYRNAFVSQ